MQRPTPVRDRILAAYAAAPPGAFLRDIARSAKASRSHTHYVLISEGHTTRATLNRRPVRDRVLAEWRADPEAPLVEITKRAGCSQGYASRVTIAAGRKPAFQPVRRRETALQRRMRMRQYWRDRRRKERKDKTHEKHHA